MLSSPEGYSIPVRTAKSDESQERLSHGLESVHCQVSGFVMNRFYRLLLTSTAVFPLAISFAFFFSRPILMALDAGLNPIFFMAALIVSAVLLNLVLIAGVKSFLRYFARKGCSRPIIVRSVGSV